MSGLIKFGTIVNVIGGILVLSSFLPQIYTIFKTKSSGNNSIQYWVIMTFGISCICVNQFICNIPKVQLIIQSINVIFAIFTTILIIHFSIKGKKHKEF
ncbi:PQ-loop domain-containing transporter [Clostridium oceanicum]|uniref:PQ loop repeat protein n=1 Tax=Clostridium oceanicum TaxID=1543 RepID=A0ABP3UUU7_9CLOT